MKYLYYKAIKGNFGDDLNDYLWNHLFENIQFNENIYFLGIGSILYNESKLLKEIKESDRVIVFGTGVRPSISYQRLILPKGNWDIKFLRGPNSAKSLSQDYPFIADAAYALRLIDDFNKFVEVEKKYEVSLMPYFHSQDYFDWESLCKELGYHYISPCSENGVEFTLQEIAASKVIITEAMHGAICADILRVPWHRFILSTPFTEGQRVSEFKWNDWLWSINIHDSNSTFIPFYRRSRISKLINRLTLKKINIEFFNKKKSSSFLINKLSFIDDFYLSSDEILFKIDDQIKTKLTEVIRDYSK